MICKIQPPNANIMRAVEYNEKKMDGTAGIREHETDESLLGIENGHVLATRNVPEGSTLTDEFDRLKLLHKKVRTRKEVENPTFHMSVNPSETDKKLTEREYVALIDELMAGLGYKDQPYRIYKHTDIAREHFHVVASRIGQDGQKIKDSYERLVLRDKLKVLAPKYGFEIVLNEREKEQEYLSEKKKGRKESPIKEEKDTQKKNEERTFVPPFSRKSGIPVAEHMKDIFNDSMKWSFTTFEQMQALMSRRYNILLEVERGEEDGDRITMSGTNAKGEPITAPLSEIALGIPMAAIMRDKMENTRMGAKKQQRKRLENLAKAAADASATYEEFLSNMERKGVYIVVSWSANGEPFGVTWLDRATKCAWKGSETERTIGWLKETASAKDWIITRPAEKTADDIARRRAVMPSRKPTIQTRRKPDDKTVQKVMGGKIGKFTGRSHGSTVTAGTGKAKDIFDENMEEKLRKEKYSGEVE